MPKATQTRQVYRSFDSVYKYLSGWIHSKHVTLQKTDNWDEHGRHRWYHR